MKEPRRRHFRASASLLLLGLIGAAGPAAAGGAPTPSFSKVFSPDTIGPGSVSALTFTVDNTFNGVPAEELAFTDTMPAGVTLAEPAFVSNSCGGIVTAAAGGSSVELSFDLGNPSGVGFGEVCEIVVNVTSSTVGTHTNTSGDLTSSLGNSGTATDDLDVSSSLPGFSKSFSPSTVEFGGRSTLTFTIDNTGNASGVANLDFTDNLPPGMLVADPANASTTCGTAALSTTLTATPGTSVIVLDVDGFIALPSLNFPAVGAGATCTVNVDVIGGTVGQNDNVSDNLLADFVEAGKAAAVLEVTGVEELLQLEKEFIDDPVAPGGTVTLEFTVTNKSRDDAATGITFDDDLEATLTGLTPTLPGTPEPPCGAGSSLSFGSGVLTLAGGSLSPEGSCTFSVELAVPAGAAPDAYLNTAGPVSGDVGGEPETGNAASDLLYVVSFPLLTKDFTDDPVGAGDDVTLEFTITNTSTSALSDITFVDELTDNSGSLGAGVGNGFLPFPVSVTLPPIPDPPCGAGSSLGFVFPGTDRQGLELTGGELAASGAAGDSCTFSVTVTIPEDFAGGTYTNTTEPISAVLDDVAGTPTVTGPGASAEIVIASAPTLTKEFIDDPVLPAGGPVTLEFNLSYNVEDGTPDATAIAFTDDLTALSPAVPGLVAASVDGNTCSGATVDISTPTLIGVSGGTLEAGESCTISVTLTVPPGSPPGKHTNTTSEVTATVDGVAATNVGAEDDLVITPLAFSKEFLDPPVIPGDTTTLRFTIQNLGTSPADDATAISFSDSLSLILPGTPDVTNSGVAPTINTCGGSESGIATFLLYTGGSLAFGSTCTVEYELTVPAGADDGDYLNVTSTLSATIDGSPVTIDPAVDTLEVNSILLAMTKEFTDDPVLPGDTVTLQFTLENLSATETVTDIAFSDDLGTASGALEGLEASSPALVNTCGGMATLPTDFFAYSGGTLGPGATCTIALDVSVPDAPLASSPPYINMTSDITGKVGTLGVAGDAASDELIVQSLTFSKEFLDQPAEPGDTPRLRFTIQNYSDSTQSDLVFSDDLEDVFPGLVAVGLPSPPCNAGSTIVGTSFLAVSGVSLSPAGIGGDTCIFDVTVSVPTEPQVCGSVTNETSPLIQQGIPVADPATALLDLVIAPTGPFLQAGGMASIETENFFSNDPGIAIGAFDPLSNGLASGGAGIKSPLGLSSNAGEGSSVTYDVQLESGTQQLWIRHRSFDASSNSVYVQIDNGPIVLQTLFNFDGNWRWNKLGTPFSVITPGEIHRVTLYRSEERTELDKLVATTDPGFGYFGLGPPESDRSGGCDNTQPVLDPIGDQTATIYSTKIIPISASDADDDALTITTGPLPALNGTIGLFDTGPGEAELVVNALPGDVGDYLIDVTVTDDGTPTMSDSETFLLSIVPPAPYLQQGDTASIEAEKFFTSDAGIGIGPYELVTDGGASSGMAIKSPDGAPSGTGAGSKVTYEVQLNSGTQQMWIRHRSFNSASNSVFVQFDNGSIVSQTLYNTDGNWRWNKLGLPINVTTPGEVHTVTLFRNEEKTELDKLVLTTNPGFNYFGLGPPESPRVP